LRGGNFRLFFPFALPLPPFEKIPPAYKKSQARQNAQHKDAGGGGGAL
jgi:hypothetical protein